MQSRKLIVNYMTSCWIGATPKLERSQRLLLLVMEACSLIHLVSYHTCWLPYAWLMNNTLLGENGSKLEKLKKADFQKFRGAFEKVLQRDRNKTPRTIKSLKAHSPWLAKFHGSNFDEQLEIPGQYSGKSRPDPAAHAKIISFDERLLPQSSLRRPKRLTMNGSDERPHNFLVKVSSILRYVI